MKNILFIFTLSLIFSCKKSIKNENKQLALNTNPTKTINCNIEALTNYNPFLSPKNSKDPYTINFNLVSKKEKLHHLTFLIQLHNGSFFVSPNSKRDFKGKLKLFLINADNKIKAVGNLIEFPLSKEVLDEHPFVNGTVNWIKKDTQYTQKIKSLTTEDFSITGYIQFTIEPKCTLEKIPFILVQKNKKLTLQLDNC